MVRDRRVVSRSVVAVVVTGLALASAHAQEPGPYRLRDGDDRVPIGAPAATRLLRGQPSGAPNNLASIVAVALSADGSRVAGVRGLMVWVWDAATGRRLTAIDEDHGGFTGCFTSVVLSGDGSRVAAAGRAWEDWPEAEAGGGGYGPTIGGGVVKVWDATTGARLLTLQRHRDPDAVALSRDGTRLVLADPGEVIVQPVPAAAAGPDPKLFIQAGDALGGKFPQDAIDTPIAADAGRALTDLTPEADAALLAAHPPPPGPRPGRRPPLTGYLELWDLATTRRRTLTLPLLTDNFVGIARSTPGGIALSPDGTRLVTGGVKQMVTLWDAQTGAVVRHFEVPDRVFPPGVEVPFPLNPDQEFRAQLLLGLRLLVFSGDGKRVASGAADGVVRVWEVSSGRLLGAVRGPRQMVRGVRFLAGDRVRAVSGGSIPFTRFAYPEATQTKPRAAEPVEVWEAILKPAAIAATP